MSCGGTDSGGGNSGGGNPGIPETGGPELESFTTSAGTFSPTRTWARSFIHSNYIYVCGGSVSGSGYVTDIQFAEIASDGTVGSFTATTPLPEGRAYHSCVVHDNTLYILGGVDNSGNDLDSVIFTPINANGTLGSFSTAAGTLNTPRGNFYTAAYGNFIYVFGGSSGGHGISSVEYASIETDGDLGSFTVSVNSLTSNRTYHGGYVSNGYVYLTGGRKNGSEDHDTVEYAPFIPGGGNGVFTESVNTLSTPRENLTCVVHNGYIYAVGGYSLETSTRLKDLEYSPLDPGTGAPGSFTTAAQTFSNDCWHAGSGVRNNTLYAIFHRDGEVEYAPFVQD
jgi:hypothetical protein